MFKDGKLFGKINLIDLLVVIIVVLLIVGAAFKFKKFNKTDDSESSGQNIVYELMIQGIRQYTIDMIQSGDIIYDSQSGVNIGVITDIVCSNATTYDTLDTGEIIEVNNPYRYDIILVIETPGIVSNDAYYANKSIELKVNSSLPVQTKYLKTTGVVYSIEVK